MRRLSIAGVLTAGILFLTVASRAIAQNPAGDLTIQIFAKPEGRQLHLLIRAPFPTFNSVSVPLTSSGQLDLTRTEAMLPSVARWWIADNIDVYEGAMLLPKPRVSASRVSLPSDNAFESYDTALAHVLSPKLPEKTQLFRDQAMLDVLLDYDLSAPDPSLAMHSRLASLASHVTTELQFLSPGSAARRFAFTGDPGRFHLVPSWSQTSRSFAASGFWRVLKAGDYLLFLFCVALQLTGTRALLRFVGVFAAASSVSLVASAYYPVSDALWFPVLIETLIALSILYMAFENIAGGQLVQRKWILALTFGVIYGVGFALAWAPMRQLAGSHPLASVVSFDAGIQAAVAAAVPILTTASQLLFRLTSGGRISRRAETVVLSVLAADLAWHRFIDRAERLSQFRFQWPVFDVALLAKGMHWITVALVLGGFACIAVAVRRYWTTRRLRASSYTTDAVTPATISSPAKRRPDPAS